MRFLPYWKIVNGNEDGNEKIYCLQEKLIEERRTEIDRYAFLK